MPAGGVYDTAIIYWLTGIEMLTVFTTFVSSIVITLQSAAFKIKNKDEKIAVMHKILRILAVVHKDTLRLQHTQFFHSHVIISYNNETFSH